MVIFANIYTLLNKYGSLKSSLTRSSLCRRLSRLVASLICYLLDYASVHEILALVTWFQYMLDISSYYGILIHCISSTIMEIMILFISSSWIFWSMYIVRANDHSCLFMVIVLLCIWDCYMYLRLYAELYHCTILIGWLVFHWVLHHSTSGMDLYNVFRPSYDPSDLTH